MIPGLKPEHLLIAPLLIPLIAGALMLFYDDRRRWMKAGLGTASVIALLAVSWELIRQAGDDATLRVYLLGNWPVPMGIVLVLDRLSALMVMLTALLALPALIFSMAGWQGKGQHFHSLFQFMLFGMNGAFMTGDLFNLFVFFEVMLAASYGLVLHGSGAERIKAGLHYIAINLTASLLFLIGVALIYGVTGTLNMAQLAQLAGRLSDGQMPLFHAGAACLGLAFLIKAGIWPMGFWLPRVYSTAAAPVAAMLALMSKVGVYAVLRMALLCFGPEGADPGFGGPLLLAAGLITMIYGGFGVLSGPIAQRVAHVALISSGTLIAMIGVALLGGGPRMLGGALYYLAGSTLAVSAMLLIADVVNRQPEKKPEDDPDDQDEDPLEALRWGPMGLGAVEDDDAPVTAMPGSLMTMAALFATLTAVLAGLPPFSGFIGKFAMISGVFSTAGTDSGLPPVAVLFIVTLIGTGFAVLLSFMQFGISRFWVQEDHPRVLALEIVPVTILVAVLVLLAFRAEPAMRMTLRAADGLLEGRYSQTVMSVRPVDPAPAPDTGDAAP
ncbi:MAG: monovalent cation/H+ antiporter subunit D [Paracoccus sp. (in: a-proteobacteria)]|uniref:monovalent cation/H+ antiporter subunit D n=1 Tax=Paracoccus sp. TaxID=267 RepID=UPI0026DFD174|nr:monovalent cation/H+ antiporter subunit D [Paracoccus sp. (in: a-proteobacteria)]MDO5620296.1 monovalent cation/H+ antiporter subunit D [Paracoccus sp. (in: a-proteobacteria)]